PGRYGAGRMPVIIPADGAGYTVFFDRSSVEVFPRTCGPTVTMRIYPDSDPAGLSAVGEADVTLRLMSRMIRLRS
ncbi:MAG: hypothetical protein MJ175_12770, partial [Clostridia bacterium]|nr:hypothetical protein [Clostridia bacterium]